MVASLEDRKVKLTLILVAIGIVLYWGIGTWLNGVHVAQKMVSDAWMVVEQNYQRRLETARLLGQLVKHYHPQATDLLNNFEKSYQAVIHERPTEKILQNPESLQSYLQKQQSISEYLVQLQSYLIKDQALQQNKEYIDLIEDLKLIQVQHEYAIRTLNDRIRIYNTNLSGFPNALINTFFNYPLLVQLLTR